MDGYVHGSLPPSSMLCYVYFTQGLVDGLGRASFTSSSTTGLDTTYIPEVVSAGVHPPPWPHGYLHVIGMWRGAVENQTSPPACVASSCQGKNGGPWTPWTSAFLGYNSRRVQPHCAWSRTVHATRISGKSYDVLLYIGLRRFIRCRCEQLPARPSESLSSS